MALITKAQVKIYLNIESGTITWDTFIDALIARVDDDIIHICNQEIESETRTDVLDGNATTTIMIPKYPVISIISLKFRSDLLYTWDDSNIDTIAASLYNSFVISEVPWLYYSSGFSRGIANYELTYVSGYALIPDDIQQVAIEMVVMYFKQSDVKGGTKGGLLGVSSIVDSQQGISVNTVYKDMFKNWQSRLSKYRRPVV